jgi:peptidyl-tRNA hydrolase, PTH1 family
MADDRLLIVPQLIVGLGNPGEKYGQTRHNIGFMVIDALSKRWQVPMSPHKKFQGEFGEGRFRGRQPIQLLKPLTYMNDSGRSIRAAIDWFKGGLSAQTVLVVYDDMDLPLGKLRLRLQGSAGGHNGMKSAIAHLGTQDFPRLRLGIGQPNRVESAIEKAAIPHVLGRFSATEQKYLPKVILLAVEAIEFSLQQGVEKSMSLYNPRSVNLPD